MRGPRHGQADPTHEAGSRGHASPGKQTLTGAGAGHHVETPGKRTLTEALPGQDSVVPRMEDAFGMSFRDVVMRTDDEAAGRASSMGARAYTDGREIGFAPGAFDPSSREGMHTIAHEFAHVAQRRGGTGGSLADYSQTGAMGMPSISMDPVDPAAKAGDPLEADADAAADAVVEGRRPRVGSGQFIAAFEKPRSASHLIPVGEIRVKSSDNGINFYFNPGDLAPWRNFDHAWSMYFKKIWPDATADIATACQNATTLGWIVPPPADDKIDKTMNVMIRIDARTHQFTSNWMAKHHPDIKPTVPPAITPGGSKEGKEGGTYTGERVEPKAELVITPQLAESQNHVKGAEITARVVFDRSMPCGLINAYPRLASFDWTVWNGEKVHDKGPLVEGRGDIAYSLALEETGQFQVTCEVASDEFDREMKPLSGPLITVVDETTRSLHDRDALLIDSRDDPPEVKALKAFEFDELGDIRAKKGQTGTTAIDEQLIRIAAMRAQLESSHAKHRISDDQYNEYIAALDTIQADYEEERGNLTSAVRNFVIRGVFTSREDSSAVPMTVTLRETAESETWHEGASEPSEIRMSLELVDMTLDTSSRGVFKGDGVAKLADHADRKHAEDAAVQAALRQIAQDFQKHNEYPDGTVTLLTECPSGYVDDTMIDTYHPRKTVKKVAGGVAVTAAIVGIAAGAVVLAPETAGVSLVAGAKAIGAVATAVGLVVGIPLTLDSMNEHMNHRRGEGADRAITLDLLSLVSMGLGAGTFSTAFRNLGKMANGMYLMSMAGSDIAQGAMLRKDYLDKVTGLEMAYHARLEDPTLTEQDKADLKLQLQQQTAAVLADASINGAFLLVSVAGTMHGFVELKYKAGKKVTVRSEFADIYKQKDWKAAHERLNDQTTPKTEEEIKLLEDVFESHAPAEAKTKTGDGGDVTPRDPEAGGTTPDDAGPDTRPGDTKPEGGKPDGTKPDAGGADIEVPDPATKAGLVDTLAGKKALTEHHAHADGSVPPASVLAETEQTSVATRQSQIDDIAKILQEVGKEQSVFLDDLRPGHVEADGTRVTPNEKALIIRASEAVEGERGLLNRIFKAKLRMNEKVQSGASEEVLGDLRAAINQLLASYREHLVMRKPDYARYADSVNTGAEFFRRYKMITGHGLTPREIADTRASAGELAMQELRVGMAGDDIASVKKLAKELNEASDAAVAAGDATDVSLIVNSTKKKSGDPRHAEAMADFVEEWANDPELHRAVSGLDNAGVESARLPPTLLWKMSARRAFGNAKTVQAELQASVTEARRESFLESLTRVHDGDATAATRLLERFETADFDAALAEINALAAGDSIATNDHGAVSQRFGGMTMEAVAASTRKLTEAMRAHRAETGDTRAMPETLGYTIHAGEQVKDMNPFTLLDQCDQAVSLGADRIGHGLILAIEPETLVRMKRLERDQVAAFRARQREVLDRVKRARITVEVNITSNTEISNLTRTEHPAGDMVNDGVKISISTDDETVLDTTVAAELKRLAEADGVSRTDVAIVILEGFHSRMGGREIRDRARLKADFASTLAEGLPPAELDALAQALAARFHVSVTEGNPAGTIKRVLDAVFGVGG